MSSGSLSDGCSNVLWQENELCLWHIDEVAASGSAYDETGELRIEDEPELIGKLSHKGDVTDLLVSYVCTHTYPFTIILSVYLGQLDSCSDFYFCFMLFF